MVRVLSFYLSCCYFSYLALTHSSFKKSLRLESFPLFESCLGHLQVSNCVYYHPKFR